MTARPVARGTDATHARAADASIAATKAISRLSVQYVVRNVEEFTLTKNTMVRGLNTGERC
jgi:hypothetical protein